jgi:tetratricopeptide (TPR) repeat protein
VRYLKAALSHLAGSYLHGRRMELSELALDLPSLLEGEQRIEILLSQDASLQALGRPDVREARLEECATLAAGSDDLGLRARVRVARGSLFWSTARYEQAKREFERARELAREASDRGQEAAATNGLANVLADLDRLEEAKAYYERNLAIAREIGDRRGEAGALGNLALVFEHQGRAAEALSGFEQCLALTRELGDRLFEARATGNLGYALRARGHNVEARVLFERALQMAVDIGYRQGEAKAAGNLGLAWADQGQHAEAIPFFERCIEISREIGSPQTEATAVIDLASTLRQLGRLEEAKEQYKRALKLGERHGGGSSLIGMGACAEDAGDVEAAERLYREALDHNRSIRDQACAGAAMLSLGGLLSATGRGEDAAALLDEALALVHGLDAPGTEVELACERALLAGGDAHAAEELLRTHRERVSHGQQTGAHYHLWRATGDADLLEEAKRLLDYGVEHAPEEYRESMLRNVRLHREIMDAWEEHGEQA